ncbi:PhoH family protein [bacterium]|nr:PhoH family protein [candidate division CSSED10-310 bacterium]
MKKIFVLDTNILLNDPESIFAFEENDVIIPITCIEEIDRFKRDQNGRGRNAREISRIFDRLRARPEQSLSRGIQLESGGLLRIELGWSAIRNYPYRSDSDLSDDERILAVALEAKNNTANLPVVLLSRDSNLRIRASAMGIDAQDYISDHTDIDRLYTGLTERFVTGDRINRLYQEGGLDLPEGSFHSNEYILLRNETDPARTGLARVSQDGTRLIACGRGKLQVWGISPKNLEQRIALDLLLDDSISLVTLVGRAGTGKTLLALAAGLFKSVDESKYRRLLVSRPIFPMGKDLGFLPGEVQDKLRPWMQPIYDNLEMLLDPGEPKKTGLYTPGAQDLIDQGMLVVEPLTYIRGRSIPYQYFVVDEGQNLTPHEIKTIVSRAGHGTKIVVTGDPYQIDNPYLDSQSTGLAHLVDRFKDSPLAGHISLVKGERSELAQAATELL